VSRINVKGKMSSKKCKRRIKKSESRGFKGRISFDLQLLQAFVG
jgi:hypothetical protein